MQIEDLIINLTTKSPRKGFESISVPDGCVHVVRGVGEDVHAPRQEQRRHARQL